MDVVSALRYLGGVATRSELLAMTTRGELRRGTARGDITRAGRGRYVSGEVTGQRRSAAALSATLSHLSAAQHWGWAVKNPPARAWVTVPRNRKVGRDTQARHHVVYGDLGQSEVIDGVTTPLRTVLDCARRLPFDEALCVADSALRARAVTTPELQSGAAQVRGRGAARCRQIADQADARSANPFESTLRAIVIESGELVSRARNL